MRFAENELDVIFKSQMKVIGFTWKHILWTFLEFLVIIIYNLKIDFIMSKPHHVKFIFWEPPP